MLELDGTDGGGQLVRTALTLSVLDGRPFRMENVRGNRPNPGLKRQHRACVELLASLSDADVSGAEVGSETLTFEPGAVPVGDATESVDVGTAGSVTLIADAVLPLAGRLEAPIRVRLVGGTDVKWSPSTDYLREVKLPLLRECGLDAAVDVRQRGFYPSGGGELAVEIRPSTLSPIVIPDQTATESGVSQLSARAVATQDLEAADVADRMAETAAETLDDGFEAATVNAAARYVDADSTGAIVTLVAAGDTDGGPPRGNEGDGAGHPRRRAGFVAHGERGVPAEDVASAAVEAATEWGRNDAPIDEHLGDQLVVWLARCGGQVRVPRVTDHVRTNVELVRAFGYDVALESTSEDAPATLSAAESR